MSTYIQETRAMQIMTPLGENRLLLQSFSGREAVSSLFEIGVEMYSTNHNIPLDALVGKRVTIRLVLRDGEERFFNGIVRNFSHGGVSSSFAHYHATIVPWLWVLTRTANCRIFQHMTAPDIITKVFRDRGFHDFSLRLHGSFEEREYCVQYRESDFHFVSRLMEDEGISYFFEHTADKHTLVLTNHPSEFKPCPHQHKARFDYSDGGFLLDEDVIASWSVGQQVRSGKYETRDFNFEQPSLNLMASTTGRDERRLEVYDYPGEYLTRDRGEQLAGVRIQEQDSGLVTAAGSSNCRAFCAGYRFDLEGHSRRDLNRAYTIMAIHHRANLSANYSSGLGEDSEGFMYRNTFECIPHGTPYRPARTTMPPVVEGTQTAIVVGPRGEEIYTDKYGRVKVQFHWDREGKRDENSSCWIRVSQPWAGKGWGAIAIPRIGQEVVVDFLEGDPDRPIITGRVYNAECMPPYPLPDEADYMGFKSDSTPGGGGYNEIVVKDRKAGEQMRIHAQKDMDTTVTNGNQTNRVKTGYQTNTVKGDMTTTVQSGNQTNTVQSGYQHDDVQGEIKITSHGGEVKIKAATKITLEVGGSTLTMDSSGNITVNGQTITSTATGAQTIKGGVVKIN